MKLQELLISLWYDEPNIHEWITDDDSHALVTYKNHKRNIISISLSDLLFSTPFLSLLERVKSPNEILVRTEFEWLISPLWCNEEWQQIRCYWNTYQYHKINLVLLNTDAERIEYIEKFTI